MAHVRDNYVERYALVMKLAYANIAEQGFHQGAGGQDQEPYYVVNDNIETFVMSGGEELEFGQFCSSFREDMNALTFCDDCGGAVLVACSLSVA